jgi:NAD(P)-dependent dehydrogenase (short-subunit alcohol dehydrogenase family)
VSTEKALVGKVIVVTGGGGGIGKAIALLAAAEGGSIVVNDLGSSAEGTGSDQGPAAAVVDEITQAGGKAVANSDSVADWDGAQRIIAAAVDAFGRIDAVINNAGILRDHIFHQLEPADWDVVLKVHLYGSFNVARAAAPHFRRQESGAFVHMTSTSGLVGNVGQANYAAAKMGIVGLSKSIALDMARFNVRSNCVAPFAWTRLIGTIPVSNPEQDRRVARMKLLTPETIAPLAVFLASDLSSPMSGQILGVRRHEVYLFSQPRPIRTLHRGEGWTPATLADHLKPAFEPSLYPLERSADVFGWEPV